jgi:hypothetical protein
VRRYSGRNGRRARLTLDFPSGPNAVAILFLFWGPKRPENHVTLSSISITCSFEHTPLGAAKEVRNSVAVRLS